jgi:Fe-S cluster biogenesis protein NfuA/nitrite reductase/ring-hydroxylating ferredoxin subunit
MAGQQNARVAGERVETLLDQLRAGSDPRVTAAAEDLVRCLVDLYGAGLERIVEIVGDERAHDLADDPLVESLLLVHDLHPLDADTRIQRALDRVRPYLGSHAGGVDYRGIDDGGVVHLRLEGSCNGCPSSTVTVRLAIEAAIQEAAPETTGIDVEGVTAEPPPPLLRISRRPGMAEQPVTADDEPGWIRVPAVAAELVGLDGVPVLVCRLGDVLYAYRDACPACGGLLSRGVLDGATLACPGCGSRYDVRLAGAGLDDPVRHLDPLPLLVDDGGVRIAVGAGAVS